MDAGQADDTRLSPFVRIPREEWGRLLAATSFSPLKGVVRDLRGVSEPSPGGSNRGVPSPLVALVPPRKRHTKLVPESACFPGQGGDGGALRRGHRRQRRRGQEPCRSI